MRPRRTHPDAPPVTEVVHTGSARADWCASCKAWTRLVGDTLLLTPDGVTTISTWSGCQICAEEEPRA